MKIVSTLGWVVIVVGILGFIPGITSNSMLLGIFEVGAATNILYIILGILAVVFAKSAPKTWGMIIGVVYLLIGLIGIFTAGSVLGLFAANTATDVLHIVLGLLFLWGGMQAGKASAPAAM